LVIAPSFQEDAIDIRLRGGIGVDVRLAAVTHDYPDRGFGPMASADWRAPGHSGNPRGRNSACNVSGGFVRALKAKTVQTMCLHG
jgi:hypothetical protein